MSARTRLPSVVYRSWSQFLAVSLQVTWVVSPAVGCHAVLSGRPAVTPATLKTGAANLAAWWTKVRWVWTVCLRSLPNSVAARRGCDLNPGPSAPESSTLTTRLPNHPGESVATEKHSDTDHRLTGMNRICDAVVKMPWPSRHWKYRRPFTIPSCRPSANNNKT